MAERRDMIEPTQPIAITLEAQQWNVVIAALMEAPWRIADPVIRAISAQTQAEQPQPIEDQVLPAHKGNGVDEHPVAA